MRSHDRRLNGIEEQVHGQGKTFAFSIVEADGSTSLIEPSTGREIDADEEDVVVVRQIDRDLFESI